MRKLFYVASLLAFTILLTTGCTKESSTPIEPSLRLTISNIEATNFAVKVESTDPETLYFVGVTTRESYDALGDPKAAAEAFVQIANQSGQVNWTEADGKLIHQGNTTIEAGESWTINPKREYAVLAFGVGEGGVITLDPVYEFVTTTEVSPSENQLDVTVDAEKGIVTVKTTNDDPYFLDCIEVDRLTDVPQERLAEHIIGIYGSLIDNCIENGDVERDFSRIIEADTDYYAVAFGYLGGYSTTEITMVSFHSAGGGLIPQDCTFDFDVKNITINGANITVIPSNPSTPYFWQVYNKVLVDSYINGAGVAQLMQDGLAIIAEALSDEYGIQITPETAASMVTVTGNDSYAYNTLEASTEYYVVAVGLDNKGRQTTEVQLSTLFTTLSPSTGPEDPMECTIQVNGLTDDGLSVSVIPADKEMTYVGMVGEAEVYSWYTSDAEFLADDIAMWSEMAGAEGMSLSELLSEYGLFLKGDQTYIFPESFEPGVLYMAYTYGLSETGEITAGMQKVFFTLDENGQAHEADGPAGM